MSYPTTDSDVVRSARSAEVLEAAVIRLTDTVTLFYLDRGDQGLTEEQVETGLRDYEAMTESVWDAVGDNIAYGLQYAFDELFSDEVEDSPDELTLQDEDALRDEIRERDDSTPIDDLIGATPDLLLCCDIGGEADQDLPYGTGYSDDPEAFDLEGAAKGLCEQVGVDWQANRAAFIELVAEQGYYGGRLTVIWYGSVTELLAASNDEACRASGGQAPRRTISWTDPQLLLLDRMNGSGHDVQLSGTVTVPLDVSRVHVDSQGYGWDSIAGVVHSAYRNDPTITILEEST